MKMKLKKYHGTYSTAAELPQGLTWMSTSEAVKYIQENCIGLSQFVNSSKRFHNLLKAQWRGWDEACVRGDRWSGFWTYVSKESIDHNEEMFQAEYLARVEDLESAQRALNYMWQPGHGSGMYGLTASSETITVE